MGRGGDEYGVGRLVGLEECRSVGRVRWEWCGGSVADGREGVIGASICWR